jgi:hypothetical protein
MDVLSMPDDVLVMCVAVMSARPDCDETIVMIAIAVIMTAQFDLNAFLLFFTFTPPYSIQLLYQN